MLPNSALETLRAAAIAEITRQIQEAAANGLPNTSHRRVADFQPNADVAQRRVMATVLADPAIRALPHDTVRSVVNGMLRSGQCMRNLRLNTSAPSAWVVSITDAEGR